MVNVFIIGSRGYRVNYGGFETFVTNLIDNYNDSNTRFFVTRITNKKEQVKHINDNIVDVPIYIKQNGSIKMLLYSIKAYKNVINYIKSNNLKNCYIYMLGLKLGNYMFLKKRTTHKYKIKTLLNPDGLEYKRSKWAYPIKLFFLYSEKSMLNNTDVIICDSKNIKEYIDLKYPKLKNITKYISYGSKKVDIDGVDENNVLKKYNLMKNNYFLIVGRCVSENNYEMIISSYLKSNNNKKLVIVSNFDDGKYSNKLKKMIDKNSNIYLIEGIYNEIELSIIRKNAYSYIHGHSVGGTNPSLLEAMRYTSLNILYDVSFNKEVGLKSCIYFKNEEELMTIFNNQKRLDLLKVKLNNKSKKIIEQKYTWEKVVESYKQIFK